MPSVDTARAILSALDDLGLTHVLYCPGSRSAPFAYALESGAFGGHAMPVLDERGAGFAAVGLARTGALPAVIVTSGTAVAELTPAVLEASHARLPLLVISADRPGELRGVGASQATFQSGLFGVHARACVDLEPQEPSRALVGQLSRAVEPWFADFHDSRVKQAIADLDEPARRGAAAEYLGLELSVVA